MALTYKIKEGFIPKTVAGKNIVVPVGGEINFNGMLTLNDTGMFFWKLLCEGITKEDMLTKITSEYDIDKETATRDIDAFINKLEEKGLLED